MLARAFRLLLALPFCSGPSMSISSMGPFLMEIPGAPFFADGISLSIALSTLLGMTPFDLCPLPKDRVVSLELLHCLNMSTEFNMSKEVI